MIPIQAIQPLIKYLDAIDEHCTAGLLHKKPHIETTITQNLCSLLDQEEQQQATLKYSFESLHKDLSQVAGGLQVAIGTHEYNSAIENRVTQSDLGLIINYINYYNPNLCWTESWLFQAKSLKPSSSNPVNYTAESKFDSTSKAQIDRIEKLKKIVEADFIRFIEYCPRVHSPKLSKSTQNKLICCRDLALADNIFDYALGLELRDCLLRGEQNLAPGIFISHIENAKPKSYLDLYKSFCKKSHPFSWFILLRLYLGQVTPHLGYSHENKDLSNRSSNISPANLIPPINLSNNNRAALAHSIVRCDPEAIEYVLKKLGDNEGDFTLYPARTITINIRLGADSSVSA